MHLSTILVCSLLQFVRSFLKNLFLLEFHRLFKLNHAVDMTNLINAHCMKLSQRIFINLIGSSNYMAYLSKFYGYLEKISVNPFLRAMYYCIHRGGYSRRKVTNISFFVQKANIEFHGLFNKLTRRFAVIRFEDIVYLLFCRWIYPQWNSFFGFTLHKTPFSHLYRFEAIVFCRYRVHSKIITYSYIAT